MFVSVLSGKALGWESSRSLWEKLSLGLSGKALGLSGKALGLSGKALGENLRFGMRQKQLA
jgi:hypothetical protein